MLGPISAEPQPPPEPRRLTSAQHPAPCSPSRSKPGSSHQGAGPRVCVPSGLPECQHRPSPLRPASVSISTVQAYSRRVINARAGRRGEGLTSRVFLPGLKRRPGSPGLHGVLRATSAAPPGGALLPSAPSLPSCWWVPTWPCARLTPAQHCLGSPAPSSLTCILLGWDAAVVTYVTAASAGVGGAFLSRRQP